MRQIAIAILAIMLTACTGKKPAEEATASTEPTSSSEFTSSADQAVLIAQSQAAVRKELNADDRVNFSGVAYYAGSGKGVVCGRYGVGSSDLVTSIGSRFISAGEGFVLLESQLAEKAFETSWAEFCR